MTKTFCVEALSSIEQIWKIKIHDEQVYKTSTDTETIVSGAAEQAIMNRAKMHLQVKAYDEKTKGGRLSDGEVII